VSITAEPLHHILVAAFNEPGILMLRIRRPVPDSVKKTRRQPYKADKYRNLGDRIR